MKAVVYFSLEGDTAYVADKIVACPGAEVIRLEHANAYPTGKFRKLIWGAKGVIFGDTPQLLPYTFDADKYDTIIIGTPFWAGSFVPPIKTFLKQHNLKGKRVAIFVSSKSGQVEPCFVKFRQEIGAENIVATLSFVSPLANKGGETERKISDFCGKL